MRKISTIFTIALLILIIGCNTHEKNTTPGGERGIQTPGTR
jgi:hypothetical protein